METKVKKLSLTHKSIYVIIGNLLPKLNNLLLIVLLAHFLDKSEFGSYNQATLLAMLYYGFFAANMADSLYFFLPQLSIKEKSIFVLQTVLMLLIMGLIAGLCIYFGANFFAIKFNNPALTYLLKPYSIFAAFWIAKDYYVHYLIIDGKYKLSIYINFLDTLTNLIAVIIPLMLGKSLEMSFFFVACLASIKFCLFFVHTISSFQYKKISFSLNLLRKQFTYTFPLTLSSWLEVASNQLGKLIVSIFYPPAIFAIYSVGSIKLPIWQILTKSTNAILRVKFIELYNGNDTKKIFQIWAEAIRKLCIIIFPIIFFLFVLSDQIIRLVFSPKYTESIIIFRILLINYLLAGISTSLLPLSIGKTNLIPIASALGFLINIIMCLLLFQHFGYLAPALATVISFYCVSFFYLVKSVRIMKFTLRDALPWKILLWLLSVNCFCSLIILAEKSMISNFTDNYFISIFSCFIVYVIIYLCLINKLNLLKKQDKILISHLVRFKIS